MGLFAFGFVTIRLSLSLVTVRGSIATFVPVTFKKETYNDSRLNMMIYSEIPRITANVICDNTPLLDKKPLVVATADIL